MRVSFRQIGLATVVAVLAMLPRTMQAQARQVAGTYTTNVSTPQGALKAVIVLKLENGVYSGTLSAEGFPTMPVSSATPSDSGVKLQVDTPDGGVAVAMKFGAGDKVTGTLNYQGADMMLDGTFAPAGGMTGASAAATATSPVGSYELKTSEPLMGDPAFAVACTVTKSASGVFEGSCGNPDRGDAPVSSVTMAGNVVTMVGDTPVGPFRVVLNIAGSDAEGTITIGSEVAKLKGRFTAK